MRSTPPCPGTSPPCTPKPTGRPPAPPPSQAARAYTHTLARLGSYYHDQDADGTGDPVPALRAEEANLLHALALARAAQHGADALGCLQGLRVLYQRTGRDGEWARLVEQVTPEFIDPATGGPLPGREDQWSLITGYRVQLAMAARDWPAATRLQHTRITWARDRAATALAAPGGQLTPRQRNQIRNLAVSLEHLGHILRGQDDPGCLPYYQEALSLYQRISARSEEANLALTLGNAYLDVPGLRDLDQAEHWYQHSLTHRTDSDTLGRAKTLGSLGSVAYERFDEARDAGEPGPVLLAHLNTALAGYQRALAMASRRRPEDLAARTTSSASSTAQAGDTRQALRHYQQSIAHEEARGDTYGAGQTRYNIALLLAGDGRRADALLYARAALSDFEKVGPGAAQDGRPDPGPHHPSRTRQHVSLQKDSCDSLQKDSCDRQDTAFPGTGPQRSAADLWALGLRRVRERAVGLHDFRLPFLASFLDHGVPPVGRLRPLRSRA